MGWVAVGKGVWLADGSTTAAVGTAAVLTVTGSGNVVGAVVGTVVVAAAETAWVSMTAISGVFVGDETGVSPQAAINKITMSNPVRANRREYTVLTYFILLETPLEWVFVWELSGAALPMFFWRYLSLIFIGMDEVNQEAVEFGGLF